MAQYKMSPWKCKISHSAMHQSKMRMEAFVQGLGAVISKQLYVYLPRTFCVFMSTIKQTLGRSILKHCVMWDGMILGGKRWEAPGYWGIWKEVLAIGGILYLPFLMNMKIQKEFWNIWLCSWEINIFFSPGNDPRMYCKSSKNVCMYTITHDKLKFNELIMYLRV